MFRASKDGGAPMSQWNRWNLVQEVKVDICKEILKNTFPDQHEI